MLTHSASIHLRYVLLLNALAALAPASVVRGRINDPLLHSSWYTLQQHSAILVVSAAAVLGSVLVYFIVSRNLRRRWIFVLSGSFTAMVPGLFYLVAAPGEDRIIGTAIAMLIVGLIWGAFIGLVIYAAVGKQTRTLDPNNRMERAREP